MRRHFAWFPTVALLLAPQVAFAQQATTVQLPTYSYFTTNTTVSVPDRGSVYLGGVKRAASGRNEFGAPLVPFGNRSMGMERSASGAWVSVYVHDFEAMDEYLLSQPPPRRSQPAVPARFGAPIGASPPRRPPPASAGDIWRNRLDAATRGSAGPLAKSVAQLRAEHQREQQARQEEAAQWFERGRKAESAGKSNVARVYYQTAARRATGPLKAQIAARLDAVDGSAQPPKLAQGRRGLP
jgi:hypothetical protein